MTHHPHAAKHALARHAQTVGAGSTGVTPRAYSLGRREEEDRPMRYTVKYCRQCIRKVSRKYQTPEATAFLNACRAIEGNTACIREGNIEADGVCFGCGKKDEVMFYEL